MSLLWKSSIRMQLKTIQKRPSPKHNNHIQSLAQSFTPNLFRFSAFIKGISFFISPERKLQASMTVEASVVLPLFLFFFLNLMTSIEMLRLHGNLELALWEVGNRMTLYGSVLADDERKETFPYFQGDEKLVQDETEEGESLWKELAGVAWSYTYVKSQIMKYLGVDYLEESPLTYGTDGLQFLEGSVYENKDCFEVVVTYSLSPLYSIAGFKPFRMANRYYGHLWNGYELPGKKEALVYVAEHGEVYHTNRNCTHLTLSVRLVTRQQAYTARNRQGQRYTACEKCFTSDLTDNVYITNEGKHFHCAVDCPGIKRTVSCVPLAQVQNLLPCQRCSRVG